MHGLRGAQQQQPYAVPFVCSGNGEDAKKSCSCCEKLVANDNLYVVYCRWDNREKQWIPVCMQHSHDFGEPPFYYRNGGFETLVDAVAWSAALITFVALVVLAATAANPRERMHDDPPSQMMGWLVFLVLGGILLLVCGGSFCFYGDCCYDREDNSAAAVARYGYV